MPTRLTTQQQRLQLYPAPGLPGAAGGGFGGVLVFDRKDDPEEVPIGGFVNVWVNRPYTLNKVGLPDFSQFPEGEDLDSDGLIDSQPYRLETAPLPPAVTVQGVVMPRSRARLLVVSGNGFVIPQQHEPVWAPFSPVQEGSIVRGGKLQHNFQMEDLASPTAPDSEKRLLRIRFTGTVETAETLYTAAAETIIAGSSWVSEHTRLVPGSVIVTLPTSGGPLRDNGNGRLVGVGGDGFVNYVTGAFEIRADAAQTGAVLVDYEHECGYFSVDFDLSWDWLLI